MNQNKKVKKTKRIFSSLAIFLLPLLFLGVYFMGINSESDQFEKVKPATMQYTPTPLPEKEQEELTVTSEEDKEKARELMSHFLQAFHVADRENPYAYIEKSKEYMTTELAAQYKDIPRRGTLTEEKTKILHMEYSPSELQQDLQIWSAVVTSEIQDANQQREIVYDQYLLVLQNTGNGWKIGEVGAE